MRKGTTIQDAINEKKKQILQNAQDFRKQEAVKLKPVKVLKLN